MEEIIPLTRDEVREEAKRLKNKKAAGLDGIHPETIKMVAATKTEDIRKVTNGLMMEGAFPWNWKYGRLVLTEKLLNIVT